ncbi:MAG TPA: ABC transporter permease [Solirubrobacteraceae bacterium]|nr:ABC transporter permease [Solirubrobacteraceae bacterium]
MLALIIANLRRRTARTALTAAGIAVGVASVVALLSLSAGLTQTAGELIHLGRADLGLFQADAGDPTTSVLPLSLVPQLRHESYVADVAPLQLAVSAVDRAPSAVVFGMEGGSFVGRRLVFTAGRPPAAGQVAVGDLLASQLHLVPGGTISLHHRAVAVAGIYHSGTAFQDQGVITSLAEAQRLAGRTPQEVTTIAVRVAPQVPVATAQRRLLRTFPGLQAISTPDEALRAGANSQLISKAVVLIVVLALIIGVLAVANTMLAAVLERRRELALLATIGWSPRQLAGLVLGEAVAVSVIGTGVGLLLGYLAAGFLPGALGLQSYISAQLTLWTLGRAMLIGVTIGLIGAVFPVWRVARTWSAASLAQA